jgi:octaprenyl-diphosphate synthase
VEDSLMQYGHNLGMAFQLVDDLLDFTATEDILGKPVGSDLREGKVTLPLIYVLGRCTAAERERITLVMEDQSFERVDREELTGMIERYETPQLVKQQVQCYSQLALESLAGLSDSGSKKALTALTELIIKRQF